MSSFAPFIRLLDPPFALRYNRAVRIIGLTGGIASGKSTVAKLFVARGAQVVDADLIAREVVKPGEPALGEIARHFGATVILPDGTLDRKALGQLVFDDLQKRLQLNAIIHPRIAERTQRELGALAQAGVPEALYEAALIVENNLYSGFDGLIVVSVDEPTQLSRLKAREGLSDQDARKRLSAQAPLSDKIKVADYVVDNSGPLAETERQVDQIWTLIRSGGPKRRNP